MSGHSKWATIKHKKGALDAKRGKIFSRLSKEMMIVAKHGGGDPDKNPSLRTLIQKAKANNMPSDNIERAIKKGTGELEGATYEEVSFEGYLNGVGIIIQALTDNRNRATAEIRHIFTRMNSSFATTGAVSRGFERKGKIFVDLKAIDEDKLMGIVLDAGADDMVADEDGYEITTTPTAFSDVADALEKAGVKPISAEVSMVSLSPVTITDKSVAQAVLKFVETLEDNDDVQNVYHNMEVSDEIMAEITKD